jgi:signal transduction histidine kinase
MTMQANSTPKASWKITSPLPAAILACLVGIVCYQLAVLSFVLGIPPKPIVASFWPATPFLVAVLLLVPKRIWPVLIVAGLGALALADLWNGVPIRFEVWITLGNLADVLVASLGLSYLFKSAPRLNRPMTLAKYFVVGVISAPLVASLVGAIGSVPGGYWLQWRVWFFADAVAFLTVTPAMLSWVREGQSWTRKSRNYVELAALLTLLVVCGYFTFIRTEQLESAALLYSLVPLLLWAGLRLGLKGVSTSMLVIAFMSIWGAAHDRGPFTGLGPLNNALSLQLFLFFAAIPFMALAVLVEEQKRTRHELADEHAQLTEAQRLAQIGSWHWDPDTDVVTWSEQLYQIAGRDPRLPAPTYKEHGQWYTPESWRRLQWAVEESLLTGRGYELDLEMVRPDGTTRWLIARGEALPDGAGRIAYLRGTVKDITDRKRTEEALAGMGRKMIQAQEQERTRIARDLHDDIGQRLGLAAVGLQRLNEALPNRADNLRKEVRELEQQILEVSADIQSLSHELHSNKVDLLGLVAGMRSFCGEFADKYRLQIDFAHDGIIGTLPQEISVCLFRVLQESLHNALKHSGQRRFAVKLHGSLDEIHLTIRDSGVGFDSELTTHNRGLGLISMSERVNMVNGLFSITSKPNSGTEISARVPLSDQKQTSQVKSAKV